MNLGLKNKVCCITGGGSNICRATALLFAACDAKTVILDIDEESYRQNNENHPCCFLFFFIHVYYSTRTCRVLIR